MRRWVHDFLRERLEHRAGILPPVEKITLKELMDEVMATTWDTNFLELMQNRLYMGRLRYGSKKTGGARYNYTKSVAEKIRLYEETGNTELLVDIANYCMLEFRFGRHPNRHFSATDDAHHCEKLD
jgi:hypothetical protein